MIQIQPQELRIGNLIHIPKTNQVADVFGVLEGLERVYVNKNLLAPLHYSEVEPIKLNEEWLLKLGYVKNERVKDLFDLRPLQLMFTPNGFEYFHGQPYGGNFLIIKHVHQLQNLYFSLTNEELTIK